MSICIICGEPMPVSEEMFKYHGLSGPCPKQSAPRPDGEVDALTNEAVEHAMFIYIANLNPGTRDLEATQSQLASMRLAIQSALTALTALEAENATLKAEVARLKRIAVDAWDAITFYSDEADLMPDRIAELLERIRPIRSLSTSQGEQGK